MFQLQYEFSKYISYDASDHIGHTDIFYLIGGSRYGGAVNVGSFLQLNIWCEEYSESNEMFCLKLVSFMSGFIKV